jgi:hypothetical protein
MHPTLLGVDTHYLPTEVHAKSGVVPTLQLNNITRVHPIQLYPNLFQDLGVRRSTLEHQVKLIRVGLYISFQICLLVNMMTMNDSRHTYIWYNNNKVKKI